LARPMHYELRPKEPIRAYTGTKLHAKNWDTEAALRMLMNCLDPSVATLPEELIVYGGAGRAARNWKEYLVEVVAPVTDRTMAMVEPSWL